MTDPVRARRSTIARAVAAGKRVGYGLFLVAVVAFFVGMVVDFSGGLVTLIVACLLVGSVVLAPSIVFDYAVKAADRDDQSRGL